MIFLRFPGISCVGTLHPCTLKMGPLQTFHRGTYFDGCRSCTDYLLILYTGYSRNYSFYACHRNWMGFLYDQLCASHGRYVPSLHLYKPTESSASCNGYVETQLWYVPYAYILARIMGDSIQKYSGTAYYYRHPMYCSDYICMLLYNDKDYLVPTGQ